MCVGTAAWVERKKLESMDPESRERWNSLKIQRNTKQTQKKTKYERNTKGKDGS